MRSSARALSPTSDQLRQWYEARSEGLGTAFLNLVDECLELIEDNPHLYAKIHRDVRRALLARFPYGVFYRIHSTGRVKIIAVLHLAREPESWKKRS